MRTSLGLCPETPFCRFHGTRYMRATMERAAFSEYNSTGRKSEQVMREVWRCTVKGCHTIFCGKQDYKPQYAARREGRSHLKFL